MKNSRESAGDILGTKRKSWRTGPRAKTCLLFSLNSRAVSIVGMERAMGRNKGKKTDQDVNQKTGAQVMESSIAQSRGESQQCEPCCGLQSCHTKQ